MLKDGQIITEAVLQEALSDGFNRQVGHGKAHSVSSLAAATGLCDSYWGQVKAYSKTPSLLAMLCAAKAMGPEHGAAFLNGVIATAGFTGARPTEVAETCPHKLTADLAHAISLIAEALEDGDFDPSERFNVAEKCRELSRMADGLLTVRKVA